MLVKLFENKRLNKIEIWSTNDYGEMGRVINISPSQDAAMKWCKDKGHEIIPAQNKRKMKR